MQYIIPSGPHTIHEGSVELRVGVSRNGYSGGYVKVDACEAVGLWEKRGSVDILAGVGSHQRSGRGGSVRLSGGHSAGMFTTEPSEGVSVVHDGGHIQMVSGSLVAGTCGIIAL